MAWRGLLSHIAHLLLLAALWLPFAHASRSQIDLSGDFTSLELARRTETNVTKNVIFVRHAQSAGNAKLWGAIEKGRWDAYKDGTLTKKGMTATEKKVTDIVDIDQELIEHVLHSDIVLVSPLRRAMATAILFLAKAKQLLREKDYSDDMEIEITEWSDRNSPAFASTQLPNSRADLLPEIRVHADLREKVKTDSDKPGADDKEDPMQYVHNIAKQCGKMFFDGERALDATFQQIQTSYLAEQARTDGWKPEPNDGYTYAGQIRNFKHYLKGIAQKNVLIVGHSGWSRYAFNSFLPVSGDENVERNLRFGARKVQTLRNVGIIQATFDNGFFTAATAREGDIDESGGKWGTLVSREEASVAGVVPAGSDFQQILVRRKKTVVLPMEGPYIRKILTFATTAEGVRTLAWTDKWGKIENAAKDFREIGQQHQLQTTQTQAEPATFEFVLDGSKVFSFVVESESDVQRLWDLVVR